MDGNGNYNSKDVDHDIKSFISLNPSGFNEVIYVLDEDKTAKQKKVVKEIKQFCANNHYKTILFNTSIEDVFLGHRVSKEKKERALEFIGTNKIMDLISKLNRPNPGVGESDVLAVLDRYLKRKKGV